MSLHVCCLLVEPTKAAELEGDIKAWTAHYELMATWESSLELNPHCCHQ